MNRMKWITSILACVMVVLTALGSVCNAVWQIAIDESFYSEKSRAAVKTAMGFTTEEEVTAYIGLTPEEQAHFAWTAREHMLGEDESIDFPHYISHDESRHMIDVRNLVWSARDTGKICLTLAAVLAVMIAWTGAKVKRRSLALLSGTISGAALAGCRQQVRASATWVSMAAIFSSFIKASAALRPPFTPKDTTPQVPLGMYFCARS